MKDYEVLEDVAEYIETNGWVQKMAKDPQSEAVCIIGAIHRSSNQYLGSILYRAKRLFADSLEINWCQIPSWNDESERTKQEVLDALQKAAKLGRIREDINDSI